MPYDLLLRGGDLLDPAQSLHARRDVAFSNGKVAAIAESIAASEARETIDCSGLIVAPGMIDLHVHVYWGGSHYGIWPDDNCIAKGVTTAVDAGSAGADNFAAFRKFIIEPSATRLFAHLNISAQGMLDADIGELMDIRFARVDRALQTIEANRDVLLGVKVRLTKHSLVSEEAGIRPLHLAREAADAAGLPIMVHPQDAWTDSLDDILAVMGKGDILTHCFHNHLCGIFDERGKIRASVHDAMARGVVFDVGHGAGSFSWDVVESAFSQGVQPTTISSDLHIYNVNGPVFDLATTASKFLYLGMPLNETIAKVTSAPAGVIHMDGQIGTLAVGAIGDAVILRLERGDFPLVDSLGIVRTANQKLIPMKTIHAGAVYTAPPHTHDHAYHHH